MKNDEVLIAERIKELKEENAKLKDKVERLQDRIDVTKIELDYLIHRYYTEESYQLCIHDFERILEVLK